MRSAVLLAEFDLSVPFAMMPGGGIFFFGASITSTVVAPQTVSKTVQKKTFKAPNVTFVGGNSAKINSTDALRIELNIDLECKGAYQLDYKWTQVSGEAIDMNFARGSFFSFPAKTFLPRSNVRLQVTVSSSIILAPVDIPDVVKFFDVEVEPTPYPYLASVTMNYRKVAFVAEFNEDTDNAGMWLKSPCSAIMKNDLLDKLPSPKCVWKTPKIMEISWTGKPSIEGDIFATQKGGVLMSADKYSLTSPEKTVKVSFGASPPQPVAKISGPATVASCEGNFTLDTAPSTNNFGGDFVIEWSSAPSIAQVNSLKTPAILVQMDWLTPGQTYSFTAKLTNWVGASATVTKQVVIDENAVPVIDFMISGQPVDQALLPEEFSSFNIDVTARSALCAGEDEQFTLNWTQVTTHDVSSWDISEESVTATKAQLNYDTTYHFSTLVTSDSGVTNTRDVIVVMPKFYYSEAVKNVFYTDGWTALMVNFAIRVVPSTISVQEIFDATTNTTTNVTEMACTAPNFKGDSLFPANILQDLGSDYRCEWLDMANLKLTGPNIVLKPDTIFTLKSKSIRSFDDQSIIPDTMLTQTVQPPSVTRPPVAAILARSRYAYCEEEMFFDGSLSSGGAGKPLTFEWEVLIAPLLTEEPAERLMLTESERTDLGLPSKTDDTWGMSMYEDLNTTLQREAEGAKTKLKVTSPQYRGRTYRIQLTVRNWLDEFSKTTFEVTKSLYALPYVTIEGNHEKVIRADERLLLLSIVEKSVCDPNQEYLFTWSNHPSNKKMYDIPEEMKYREFFLVPPGSLEADTVYRFVLNVTVSGDSKLQNFAEVKVEVLPSKLDAVIAGGDRLVSLQDLFVLDASSSSDPDNENTVLTYEWDCRLMPAGVGCFEQLDQPVIPSLFVINGSALEPTQFGTYYEFSVTVGEQNRFDRNIVESVRIETITNATRDVNIKTVEDAKFTKDSVLLQPTDKPLILRASLPNVPVDDFSYQWFVRTENLNMSTPNILGSSLRSANLVINPNMLQADVVYKFQVSAYVKNNYRAQVGLATIEVLANSPPTSGSCKGVSQKKGSLGEGEPGKAAIDKFELSCTGWLDSPLDQPLQYCFDLLPGENQNDGMPLSYCQTTPTINVLMPKPKLDQTPKEGVEYTVKATIVDQRGAVAYDTFKVNVTWFVTYRRFIDEDEDAALLVESTDRGNVNTFNGRFSKILTIKPDAAKADMLATRLESMANSTFDDSTTFAGELSLMSSLVGGVNDNTTRVRSMNFVQERLTTTMNNPSVKVDDNIATSALEVFNTGMSKVLGGIKVASGLVVDGNPIEANPNENATLQDLEELEREKEESKAFIGVYQTSMKNLGMKMAMGNVPGQKPNSVKTGNLEVTASKRRRGQTGTFDGDSDIAFPSHLLVDQAGTEDDEVINLISKSAENPFKGLEDTDDSVSGTVAVSFSTADGFESKIGGLPEPITICIDRNPLKGDNSGLTRTEAVCRWNTAGHMQWSKSGCVVNREKSTASRTCCECNHLTTFNIGEALANRWNDLLAISELKLENFEMKFKALEIQDFLNISVETVMLNPDPGFMCAVWTFLYMMVLPFMVIRDRKAKKYYVKHYVYDTDDTFTFLEVGSIITTVGEVKKSGKVFDLEHHEICMNPLGEYSNGTFDRYLDTFWVSLAKMRSKKRKPRIEIVNVEGPANNKLVFQVKLIEPLLTDWTSYPDPIVGLLFKNNDEQWVPYGRTELSLNVDKEHTFKRRFVIPADEMDREMAFCVFDHDRHYGVVEKVSKTNQIFVQEELFQRGKFKTFQSSVCFSLLEGHQWLSLYFDSGNATYPSVDKLNTTIIGVFTLLLLSSAIYTDNPAGSEFIADMILAFQCGLIFLPLHFLISMIIKYTGHPDGWLTIMTFERWEHSIRHSIDVAHDYYPPWVLEMGTIHDKEKEIQESIKEARKKKAFDPLMAIQDFVQPGSPGANPPVPATLPPIDMDEDPVPPPPPPAQVAPTEARPDSPTQYDDEEYEGDEDEGDEWEEEEQITEEEVMKATVATIAVVETLGLTIKQNADAHDNRLIALRLRARKHRRLRLSEFPTEKRPPCGLLVSHRWGEHELLAPRMMTPNEIPDGDVIDFTEMEKKNKYARMTEGVRDKKKKEEIKAAIDVWSNGGPDPEADVKEKIKTRKKCGFRFPEWFRIVMRVFTVCWCMMCAVLVITYGVQLALEEQKINEEHERSMEQDLDARLLSLEQQSDNRNNLANMTGNATDTGLPAPPTEVNAGMEGEFGIVGAGICHGPGANYYSRKEADTVTACKNLCKEDGFECMSLTYFKKNRTCMLHADQYQSLGPFQDAFCLARNEQPVDWFALNMQAMGQEAVVTEPLFLVMKDFFVIYCGGQVVIDVLYELGLFS
jgi:hypothetical protein